MLANEINLLNANFFFLEMHFAYAILQYFLFHLTNYWPSIYRLYFCFVEMIKKLIFKLNK